LHANTGQLELINNGRIAPEGVQWQVICGLTGLLTLGYLILCIPPFILWLEIVQPTETAQPTETVQPTEYILLTLQELACRSLGGPIAMIIGICIAASTKSYLGGVQVAISINWAVWLVYVLILYNRRRTRKRIDQQAARAKPVDELNELERGNRIHYCCNCSETGKLWTDEHTCCKCMHHRCAECIDFEKELADLGAD
jgi:hypothetical protein